MWSCNLWFRRRVRFCLFYQSYYKVTFTAAIIHIVDVSLLPLPLLSSCILYRSLESSVLVLLSFRRFHRNLQIRIVHRLRWQGGLHFLSLKLMLFHFHDCLSGCHTLEIDLRVPLNMELDMSWVLVVLRYIPYVWLSYQPLWMVRRVLSELRVFYNKLDLRHLYVALVPRRLIRTTSPVVIAIDYRRKFWPS